MCRFKTATDPFLVACVAIALSLSFSSSSAAVSVEDVIARYAASEEKAGQISFSGTTINFKLMGKDPETRNDAEFRFCSREGLRRCSATVLFDTAGVVKPGGDLWHIGYWVRPADSVEYGSRKLPPEQVAHASAGHWRYSQVSGSALWHGPLRGCLELEGGSSIAQLLPEWGQVEVVSDHDQVGGLACILIKANGPRGTLQVWIAPERDHHVVQYELIKSRGDTLDAHSTPNDPSDPSGALHRVPRRVFERLHDVGFAIIDGHYVPDRGKFEEGAEFDDGLVSSERMEFRRSEIRMNPTLAQFLSVPFDVPDGTPAVAFEKVDPVSLEWFEGDLRPRVPTKVINLIDAKVPIARSQVVDDAAGWIERVRPWTWLAILSAAACVAAVLTRSLIKRFQMTDAR